MAYNNAGLGPSSNATYFTDVEGKGHLDLISLNPFGTMPLQSFIILVVANVNYSLLFIKVSFKPCTIIQLQYSYDHIYIEIFLISC